MSDRIQRNHAKSLGGILALQEKIANDWHAARSELSEALPMDTPEQQERRVD